MWAIGCIFAELLTTNPLFPGKEKDTKNPNLFQDIQLDKIFHMLGKPNSQKWPDLVRLPDWKDCNPDKVPTLYKHMYQHYDNIAVERHNTGAELGIVKVYLK